jgi:DNA-binding transcriptional LysR family regulator
VKGALTLDSHHLMMEAALAGLGLIYTSEWNVEQALAEGKLVRVLEDWIRWEPGLRLYYSGRRHVPAGLRAFIELIREVT